MSALVRRQPLTILALTVCFAFASRTTTSAEQVKPNPSQPPPTARRIGVQGFGTVGVNWPAAKESFEAAGLDTRLVEFGGGAQVTDIWRRLFVEVSASRWSSAGERVFIDESGNRFPLDIPLDVKATHIDVSLGWKFHGQGVTTYVGGGAGSVKYSEESPFAQSGDDLDTRATSYHLLLGVEVPLLKWLGVAGDVRYRFVPDLLGTGGVSGVLEEDRFGGLQAAIGLRVGFGGSPDSRRKQPPPPPAPKGEQPETTPSQQGALEFGVVVGAAPVFLLPDASRKPLRILEAGTSVKIVQRTGEWLQIEFQDRQFGPRRGYVQRAHVRVAKQKP